MEWNRKSLAIIGLCLCLVLGTTACGGIDGSQTVVTVGDRVITMGEANFYLRYSQMQAMSYYNQMYAMYGMDQSMDYSYFQSEVQDGETFGDQFKDTTLEFMEEWVILDIKSQEYNVSLSEDEKAEITKTAADFIAANSESVLKQLSTDQASVEQVLTWLTISEKVKQAIFDSSDVEVSDEEAAQRGFVYLSESKNGTETDSTGNTIPLTEEELQAKKDGLSAIAATAMESGDLSAAAEDAGKTATKGSYGSNTEDYTDQYGEKLLEALEGLTEGQVSEVFEDDTMYYVAQITADYDAEATQSKKDSLITEKKQEEYDKQVEAWKTELKVTVDDKVWNKLVFDRNFVVKQVETDNTTSDTTNEVTAGEDTTTDGTQGDVTIDQSGQDTTTDETQGDTAETQDTTE